MSEESREPRWWLVLVAVLAAVAAVYAGALEVPFFWDDHMLVENEPRVRQLAPLWSYFDRGFWANPALQSIQGYFRPLTTLSLALDYRFWEGDPAGFHLTNLILHLLCCGLVFGLCRRGGAPVLACALGAALFGAFPRLTESATWVAGRTDLLAGLFALAALLLHDPRPGGTGRRCGAAVLVALGLLGKEVAAASAVGMVVLEWRARQRDGGGWRRSASHLAPLGAAMAAYLALRLHAAAGAPEGVALGGPARAATALEALGRYVIMLLDPLRPQLVIGRLGDLQPGLVALGAVVAAGVAVGALRVTRRTGSPMVLVGAALAAAALLPVLHLVPLPLEVITADRFLYLPVAGLAVAFTCAAAELAPRGRRATALLAGALLPLFLTATYLRNADWSDPVRLWEIEAARAPRGSSIPERQLGTIQAWRGETESALAHYRRAYVIEQEWAEIRPGHSVDRELIVGIALVLSELGRYEEAIPIAEGLVREQPHLPRYRGTLGAIHARNLDFDAAERELLEALRLHPGYRDAKLLLRQVRHARSRWAALPPETEDEPIHVVATRAAIYVQVGRLADASAAWARVADAPLADLDLVRRATLFLVIQGDVSSARRALLRLRSQVGASPEIDDLDRALRARVEEGWNPLSGRPT